MILLYLLLFIPSLYSQQWIHSPQLDCRRVHPSFCCTSRIRSVCPNECSTVQCGPDYYQRLYSTDLVSGTSARDGSVAGSGQVHREEQREIAVVDATVPTPIITQMIPTSTSFPTLIPFEPNIDNVPSVEKDINWVTTAVTTAGPATTAGRKVGKTPDPRIIRPPDASLVLIGDYEDGDSGFFNLWKQRDTPGQTPVVSNTGTVTLPSTFIAKEENIVNSGAVLSRSIPSTFKENKNWQRQNSLIGSENGAVDGIAGRKKDIANGISSLISQFKITPSENKVPSGQQSGSASVGHLPFRPEGPQQPWHQTPAPWGPATGNVPWQTTISSNLQRTLAPRPPWQQATVPPVWTTAAPNAQCGVAPQFSPCVSSEVASSKLLACCRQKNLPIGCQNLCRYDITQKEVRAAFDKGECGLLNVAPFLDCASQGRDNSQCCAIKGVVQKAGLQCLQFCQQGIGIAPLGLQHIACGNVIGDILHCHHSGIRP